MLNLPQQVIDDALVIDRWCGYHGGFVKANKTLFMQHLHKCELERGQDYFRPENKDPKK